MQADKFQFTAAAATAAAATAIGNTVQITVKIIETILFQETLQ